MDPSKNLEQQFVSSTNDLVEALVTPVFYIEIIMIGCALALAILMGTLINQHLRKLIESRPHKYISNDILLKSLQLITPILAILYFTIVKPFAERYGDSGYWVNAAVQLSVAYVMAKAALLVVQSKPVAYFIAVVIILLSVLQVSGFLQATTAYLDSMSFKVGQINLSLLKLVHGFIILVIVLWVASTLSRTFESYLRRSSSLSYNARELTVKFVKLLIYFVALMITLSSMGVDLTAFAVFGGALGVGIGLGLQKITANFVSGISLLVEKSIQIGDWIQLGAATEGIAGWVRQLNIRYTLIESPDGREILIPNEELISNRVINWTHSNFRAQMEIAISVSYDSDPKTVMALMLDAAKEHYACMKDPKPGCVLKEFGENGMVFSLTFWLADIRDGRLSPKSDIMVAIIEKFKANKIHVSTPNRDIRIISVPEKFTHLGEEEG